VTKRNEDFLSAAKASSRREKIEIEGLPVVYAQPLTEEDVEAISARCLLPGKKPEDGDNAYDNRKLTREIVCASIVDAKGRRVIPEGKEAELRKLPAHVSRALVQHALRVNGMTGESAGNG
jgi:hypothetical protein